MTPEEYANVKRIFAQAIEFNGEDRQAFLRRECGPDSATYREVESLLSFHQEESILVQGKSVVPAIEVPAIEVTAPSKFEPFLVLDEVWEANRHELRRRLVIVAVAMAILSLVSMLRLATTLGSGLGYGIRIFASAVSLGLAWRLHHMQEITVRGLRIAELIVMSNVGLLELVIYFRWMIDLADQGDVATLVSVNDWHYITWTMMIFVYGVFMPNTWQRAASILIPVAMVPAIAGWALVFYYPEIGSLLNWNQFGEPLLAPFAAAGVAIYGAHSIHAARVIASKARKLAQYRLIRLIGEGGMGQVYVAEHLLLKRACAVKLIQPERNADDLALRRFQREVRATARLTHPHTIEVFDYGKSKDGIFFFAMELLPGMNLRELVKVAGPLPPARVVHFLVDVCEALSEAHEAGMIHRDIKPANIFASQRGGIHDYTKLLDFGVVREIKVEPNLTTTIKMVAGTPSYMSPEQATGPLDVDPRSDLYSVGAVGYYLLSGRPPFVGSSPIEVMMELVNETPERLSVHRADVPADLESVLMRCLAKDPDQRFQSAKELSEAFGRCVCAGGWTDRDAASWWKTYEQSVEAGTSAPPAAETVAADDTEA